MFRRKDDIAPKANISVSSTYCDGSGCYNSRSMVDGDRSESAQPGTSWASDGSREGSVEFMWQRPYQGMEQIYFIGSSRYPVSEYTIDVSTASGWKRVADVTGNRENKICHRFPPTAVSAIRITGRGSTRDAVDLYRFCAGHLRV